MCYRQVVTEQPIVWNETGWMDPNTLLGDPRWWGDYRVGVDVLLEQPGYVELLGRVSSQRAKKNAGYHLRVWGTGEWSLYSQCLLEGDVELAKGTVPFGVGAWHRLELEMKGDAITVRIDGEERATVHDDRHTTGSIGLGVSVWQNAQFDNVSVEPTAPWPRFVPHDGMTVSATSEHARNHRGYEFHRETPSTIVRKAPGIPSGIRPLPCRSRSRWIWAGSTGWRGSSTSRSCTVG